jgi:hypothetical protein
VAERLSALEERVRELREEVAQLKLRQSLT